MSDKREYGWVHVGTLATYYKDYRMTYESIVRIAFALEIPKRQIYGKPAIRVREWNLMAEKMGLPLVMNPAIILVATEEE